MDNLKYESEVEAIKELNKRKGRISMTRELIETISLDWRKLLFGNFYPINVEFQGFDKFVYYGFSEHFEIVDDGFIIPEYIAEFTTSDDNKLSIKFIQVGY